MLNKYLSDLKALLIERNVEDVDDIIDYFNEMIDDRMENGEQLEDIINSLGDVTSIAENFGEAPKKEVTRTVENTNETQTFKDINKFKLECVFYDCQILPSNNNEVTIEYERTSSTYLNIKQKGDTLIVSQEFDNVFKGLFNIGVKINSKSLKATIYLPNNLEEVKIENVSGDHTIKDNTFNKIRLENVSGDIKLDDINCNDIKLESVSGDILVNNLIVDNKTDMEIVSGDIIANNVRCSYIDLESVSGDITISVDGSEKDTNIHIEKLLSDTKTKVDSDKYLKAETVSGKIKYQFLND